jgi:hypothetical protein
MKNYLTAFNGIFAIGQTSYVALYQGEFGVCKGVIQVMAMSGGKIIKANHLEAPLKKSINKIGTYEPGTAGNEDFCCHIFWVLGFGVGY